MDELKQCRYCEQEVLVGHDCKDAFETANCALWRELLTGSQKVDEES